MPLSVASAAPTVYFVGFRMADARITHYDIKCSECGTMGSTDDREDAKTMMNHHAQEHRDGS